MTHSCWEDTHTHNSTLCQEVYLNGGLLDSSEDVAEYPRVVGLAEPRVHAVALLTLLVPEKHWVALVTHPHARPTRGEHAISENISIIQV